MRRLFAALAFTSMLAAVGVLPHAANAQQYVPRGIAVAPGLTSDYIFVVWNDQVKTSNYVVDEYQFANTAAQPWLSQGAYLQGESPTISISAPFSFAGITAGFNSDGAFFNPTAYMAFQYAPIGLLGVDTLNLSNFSGWLSPSSEPMHDILPTTSISAWSQFSNDGLPITVTGLSEDFSGNLTFASQLGPDAAYEAWIPNGQPIGNTAIYLGTSSAGGPTASCSSYAIAPDGGGRSLYWNSGTGATFLENLGPNGFEPLYYQPAMQTQMRSNWVPVSVSATQDSQYGAITQVLWDGVTSPTRNSAMVWNFRSNFAGTTSQQTWVLPAGSVTVGMAADNNNSNQTAFLKANYMGIPGGAPNYDGYTYVLATDGSNNAMLYQVPVSSTANTSTVVGTQITVAG